MKKEVVLGLLLLSLIMLSTMTLQVSAADNAKIGVRIGDTADYSCTHPTMNYTIHIHILQINGTSVTVNIRLHYSNGSEGPDCIVTGNLTSTPSGLLEYLIPANLSAGDRVMPIDFQYTINDTTTMNVLGLNRMVNHIHYHMIGFPLEGGGSILYTYDGYFDKITGLAVKIIKGWNSTRGTYIQTLTATTAFTTQNTEQGTIALLASAGAVTIVLATIAIAAIAQRKHLNPHRTSRRPLRPTRSHKRFQQINQELH